MLQMEPSIESG